MSKSQTVTLENPDLRWLPWSIIAIAIVLGLHLLSPRPIITYFDSMSNDKVSAALNKNQILKKAFADNKLNLFYFNCHYIYYDSDNVKTAPSIKITIYDHFFAPDDCFDIVITPDNKGNLLYFGDDEVNMHFGEFMAKLNGDVSALMQLVVKDIQEHLAKHHESEVNLKSWQEENYTLPPSKAAPEELTKFYKNNNRNQETSK